MNKRIFAWSGVMLLLAAVFVWGMTGHPKAAVENSMPQAGDIVLTGGAIAGGGAISGGTVNGGVVSGGAVSGGAVSGGSIKGVIETKPKINLENTKYVETSKGKIVGQAGKKAFRFMGIPYGTAERWAEPVPMKSWQGEKKCTKAKKAKGDDALFLNVYRPKKLTHGVPVMVFLHGGGNVGGTPNLNFSTFVDETETIVVSVEFRQGAFGWLQSEGLKTGNPLTDSGNFAMLDIKLALQWVQENIGAFGGDASNVTLSGFSAGARDTLNAMISPIMSGLFHKVISFSGGMTTCSIREGKKWTNDKLAGILVRRGRFAKKKRALSYVRNLSKRKKRKLLYSLTDKEIKRMAGSSGLRLTNFPQCFRDGKVIPKDGFDCLEYGEYHRVPMIIGTNRSEFANVSYKSMQRILTKKPATFRNRKQFYHMLKMAKQYGSQLQSSFYLEKLAAKIAIDPYHSDIYTYRFQWGETANVTSKNYAKYVGAIHGMDLDFLLNRYKRGEKDTSDCIYNQKNKEGREELSEKMRGYVKRFLYTGNPNTTSEDISHETVWKPWSKIKNSNRIMTFSATCKKAQTKMTNKYINRAKVKRQMRRRLSKWAYKFLKTRILNNRFFA
ncbi:MAG: carboxylesterase family protein [Clostridiales bacterium]|nr:carboxylesterase family protein [Clostridiales bacterium]